MGNGLDIITERLDLKPLKIEDATDLFEIFSDEEAMRFMGTPPHRSVAETKAEIEEMLVPESGWLTIRLRNQPTAIGYVGYLGNPGVPGMGYILHPAYWRQGYMTEAIRAALDYGFTGMGLDRVELWINDENIPSQKLAQKIGFTRRGRFRMKYGHQNYTHEKYVYGMYRTEWLAERPAEGQSVHTATPPAKCYSLQPVLSVPDVKTTAEFYRDVLGFSIEFFYGDPPTHAGIGWCDWTTEGAHFQLSQESDVDAAHSGVALYVFVGPDIDTLYKTYQAAGVAVVREIASHPWNMREFSIRDCNGYILRFGTPV